MNKQNEYLGVHPYIFLMCTGICIFIFSTICALADNPANWEILISPLGWISGIVMSLVGFSTIPLSFWARKIKITI